ncbi:MAG: hypothetical protein DRP74_08770 [Candidatus Omnitrophota bacterium]|nr:MAG: hypothetical protein DRP74_08770 [Candidatus Omnitrophota bacterium]
MFNKNHLFKKLWIFVAVPILLFPSTTLHAEISETELMNLLREKDQISNTAGYTISFVIVRNAKRFDPDQGLVFMNCQVTWTRKDVFAMKISYHYEHPPVFAPIGTCDYKAIDYDKEGSLILWRSLEKYVVFAPDRNDKVEKIKSFFVDPNGILVDKGGTQTILQHFPVGNLNSIYEFNQFQLAAGRELSKELHNIMSIKSLSSGLVKVTAEGSCGPGLEGHWELMLDPNSDYLARKAVFTIEGMDRPSQVTTSSGVVAKDEIRLARSGTYKYSTILELSFEVTDISKVVGENKLYNEVLSYLNSPLPSGAQIIDRRGEKPIRTTVK